MKKTLTMGSLFDGIGGFPLAGKYAGIVPVWGSEIEPFPIRVTEKRLPEMRHYGDVHCLNGAELPPVDVITFGSPCQDLSIAGRRNGLDGQRSGLFFEAVRVIKEMREATHDQYPKWALWENVPGALSSQHGQDFREVLQSLVRIKEPTADVPLPQDGRWSGAGEIVGDGFSLAWRILDAAQGWGVPQRRKRIFLVLDLDGQRAGKVLFESEGMSRYSPPRQEAWQGAAGDTEGRAGAAEHVVLNDLGGARMDVLTDESATLRAQANGHMPCVLAGGFCTEHSADSRGVGYEDERSPTLRAGVVPGVAIEYNPTDSRIKIKEDGICQTLCSRMGTGGNQVPLTLKIRGGCEGGGKGALIQSDLSATLGCNNDQTLFAPKAYGISSDQSNAMLSDNPHSGVYEADTSRTLDCSGGSPSCNQGGIAIVEPIAFTQNQRDEVRDLGNVAGALCAEAGMKQQTYIADFMGGQGVRDGELGYRQEQPPSEDNTAPDVVYAIQGNMIGRKDENGPQGTGINEEVCFTLNTIDRPAVAAPMLANGCAQSGTLTSGGAAKGFQGNQEAFSGDYYVLEPPDRANAPIDYIVRRLTPGECCRLQGFPDGWCELLSSPNPSEEEIDRWVTIFEDMRQAMDAKTKPKTRRQITKWLQDPHSDTAEYKAYGNSVAVPCVFFVLAGIVWAEETEE